MTHSCIPDAIQLIGSFVRDNDEALRLAGVQTKVLGFRAVYDDYSVQAQVRTVHGIYAMTSVAQQQAA